MKSLPVNAFPSLYLLKWQSCILLAFMLYSGLVSAPSKALAHRIHLDSYGLENSNGNMVKQMSKLP